MVVGLVVLAVITVGVETHIDKSLVESSGLLKSSLLGWQLIYILPVAILTNDFFISGFWMRTFASKTDRDLIIGTSIATVAVTFICKALSRFYSSSRLLFESRDILQEHITRFATFFTPSKCLITYIMNYKWEC